MVRFFGFAAVFLALGALAACGPGRVNRASAPASLVSKGPIASACLSARRSNASQTLCGCVQQTANRTLSSSDQRRGAVFFSDPHRAQEIRQSGTEANSAFWLRWKAFGEAASKQCR
ncbi:MAG: hypothetical protein AB8B51_08775 [Sedimentitalea sp.]